jgi:hypothetical protein
MEQIVSNYIRNCEQCSRAAPSLVTVKPLQPIKTTSPMELLQADYAGPLDACRLNGAKYEILFQKYGYILFQNLFTTLQILLLGARSLHRFFVGRVFF